MIVDKGRIRTEKIVLLGSATVGKTSIVNRAVHDKFNSQTASTVGAQFMTKSFTVDGVRMKLDIWDTSGSEKYRSLAPMYYREARAAIIVFDVTNKNSLTEAEIWIKELREHGAANAILVAAANKTDLADKRVIPSDECEEFKFSHSLDDLVETSAVTGAGISSLFDSICQFLAKLPPAYKDIEEFAEPVVIQNTPTRAPTSRPTSTSNYNSTNYSNSGGCSC